ncbi:MAG TPA: hypothetical protein DCG42_07100 [Maribacter sp.]|nr:hypothetical protein [Maribacter sp.]
MPNIKDFQEIAQQALKKTVTKDMSSIYNNAARDRKESINETPRDPDPNVLHKFASYNALFTLSALSQSEIRNTKTFFQSKPHDIIAQSAGIGAAANVRQGPPNVNDATFGLDEANKKIVNENTNLRDALYQSTIEFNKSNDIFFKSVEINSVPGPNDMRRFTPVTKINMELEEPYGLTLIEKIKAAAAKNNFLDHLDAAYLLTIEFKGFDEQGKPTTVDMDQTKRVIPVKLVRLQVNVNQGGATYTLIAIPYNEFGFTNTYMYPKTSGQLSSKSRTIAEVVANLQEVLNSQNDDDRENNLIEIPDQYQITIDEDLFPNEKLNFKLVAQAGMYDPGDAGLPEQGTGGIDVDYIKFTSGTSIMKILEELMKAHPKFGVKTFEQWAKKVQASGNSNDYNSGKDSYFKYFKIRSTIEPIAAEFDKLRQTNKKLVKIVIEPYYISAYNVITAGLHQAKNFATYIAKEYNYIFTGDNIDIQELDINYKVAYFQSKLKDSGPDGGREFDKNNNPESQDVGTPTNPIVPGPFDYLNLKSEVNIHKGANAGRTSPGDAKLDQFLDYLTNPAADMIQVDMTILGDPAWIGQSQFIPPTPEPLKSKGISTDKNKAFFAGGDKTNIWNPKLRCYNAEVAEPVILLNFVVPDDVNDRKGTYEISEKQKAVFSGLYRVYRVTSSFTEGQFTQELKMARFNNQDRSITPSGNRTRTKIKDKFIRGSTPYHGGTGGLHTGEKTSSRTLGSTYDEAGIEGYNYDPDRDAGI